MKKFSALLSQPLTDSDIHIWCASLSASPEDLFHYTSLLSNDELERAKRFYFEKDRNHFIVGRGLLRTILGSYLDVEPPQIEFVYGQYGKPALKTGTHKTALEFNLSHSKDLALYAFSLDRKIGIDIEYVRPMPDMDDFARQFFSLRENILINSLSGKQKEEAFFKIWTCKEAFLKGNGSGLTVPINQVETILNTDGAVMLTSVDEGEEQAENWRLEAFSPVSGYQAALAVEGNGGQILLRHLKENLVK
jgi:4'-phosphopantetheinyl transferase